MFCLRFGRSVGLGGCPAKGYANEVGVALELARIWAGP